MEETKNKNSNLQAALEIILDELEDLAETIDLFQEDQKTKIIPLFTKVLDSIQQPGSIKSDRLKESNIVQPLVELSRELIVVYEQLEPDYIGKKIIPSYDLFLPFKAKKISSDERNTGILVDLKTINVKVNELKSILAKKKISAATPKRK